MKLDKKSSAIKSIKYIIRMSLLTSLFLYFKNYLITRYFPNSPALAEYKLAFREISLFAFLLSQSIMLSLISTYRSIEEKEGRESVLKFINNIFNILLISLGLVTILSYLSFNLDIFKIREKSFINLISLGLPVVFLSSLKVVYTAFLQMRHGFFAGPRGNLARSFIYVLTLLVFKSKLSMQALMITGVVASLAQLYIAYKGTVKHEYNYEFVFDIKNKHLKSLFKAIFYTFFILGIYRYASLYKDSNLLDLILVGVLFTAITTVIYPLLVEEYERTVVNNRVDYGMFNEIFVETLMYILKWVFFFMLVFLFQSSNIKDVFSYYGSRKYNLFLTSGLSFFAVALMPLIIRTFLSYREYISSIYTVGTALILATLLGLVTDNQELSYALALFVASLLGLSVINTDISYSKNINFEKRGNILFKSTVIGFLSFVVLKLIEIILVKLSIINTSIFLVGSVLISGFVYFKVYSLNENIKYRKAE